MIYAASMRWYTCMHARKVRHACAVDGFIVHVGWLKHAHRSGRAFPVNMGEQTPSSWTTARPASAAAFILDQKRQTHRTRRRGAVARSAHCKRKGKAASPCTSVLQCLCPARPVQEGQTRQLELTSYDWPEYKTRKAGLCASRKALLLLILLWLLARSLWRLPFLGFPPQ